MKTKIQKLFLPLLVLFFLISCRENPNEPAENTSELRIEGSELTVISGLTLQFFAKATLEDGLVITHLEQLDIAPSEPHIFFLFKMPCSYY